jgi:hypothetical protein
MNATVYSRDGTTICVLHELLQGYSQGAIASAKGKLIPQTDLWAYLYPELICELIERYKTRRQPSTGGVYIDDAYESSSVTTITESEFKKTLFEKIENDDFEYGVFSETDKYLEKVIGDTYSLCFKWIYDLYRENYDNEQFVVGLLRTLAHVPRQKITKEAVAVAGESLECASCDIKENAVMVFENWEYTDAIPLLEKVSFNDAFLDEYLQGVIDDLRVLQHEHYDQKV